MTSPRELEPRGSESSAPTIIAPTDAALQPQHPTPPNQGGSPTDLNQPFKPTRAFLLAYIALCVLALVAALDATTLPVALPDISSQLHGTALEAFWTGTGFLLASCVLQPSIASFSSIFGRRIAMQASCIFFGIGSIVAALANSFTVLLVGRAIQGIGGGGILAVSEVIITDLIPLAHRGVWLSGFSASWAIGTVIGPILGAGIIKHSTWRWIFWLNLPILAIGMALIHFFLRTQPLQGGLMHKLGRFDWTGSFLFTAGTTILLFGISVGGVMYEWASYQTLLPLLLGVVVIAVFAYWELRFAKEPMIQKGIFINWSIMSGYLQSILHGMILWSLIYFLALYYQGVLLKEPLQSGIAVLPETLTVAPAAGLVGFFSAKYGKYRWGVWIGWALTTLGAGLLCLLETDSTTGQWIGLNITIGIGTGMLFTSTTLTIQASSDPALNADAVAFMSFIRVFGQSIGIATSGVIFQNAFRSKLIETGIPALVEAADVYSRDATAMVLVIQQMPSDPLRAALINAYNEGLHVIWYSLIAFGGAGFLLGLTIKGYTLNQEHVSNQRLSVAPEKRVGLVDEESKGQAAGGVVEPVTQ